MGKQLKLFEAHPLVKKLFRLRDARDMFAALAQSGKASLPVTDMDCEQMAFDVQVLMNSIMARLSVDGEPVLGGI